MKKNYGEEPSVAFPCIWGKLFLLMDGWMGACQWDGTYRVKDAFAPAGAVGAVGALLECTVHAGAYERHYEHRYAQCVARCVDVGARVACCWVSGKRRVGAWSGERREDDAGRDHGYGDLCEKRRGGRRRGLMVSIRAGAPAGGERERRG